MNAGSVISIQQLIGAAVTPVALIAACATLVLVINAKLGNLSDRLRAIATECRAIPEGLPRRRQLLDETKVFIHRYRLTYWAHVLLNLATICFILTVPIILVTERRLISSNHPTIALFAAGITLMLTAMCLEVAEISLSWRSLYIELNDVLSMSVAPPGSSAPPASNSPGSTPSKID